MSPEQGGDGSRGGLMFIMRRFSGGGVQRQTVSLIAEMMRQGERPSLLVLDGRGPIRTQVPDGCEVVDLGCPDLNRAMLPLARELRRRRPRVVISTHRPVNWRLVLLRLLLHQPQHLILTERNPLHSARSRYAGLRVKAQPIWIHFLYPFASRLVAVSRDVAESLHSIARLRMDVAVIPNGIDLASAWRQAEEAGAHPWIHEPDCELVLGIGRLTTQKDFHTLLRAFARLPGRLSRLIILGEGPDRGALQALSRELGIGERVALPGFVLNPFPFLKRCDVFVSSSRWEGFGNVILEAMACGAPIVATDCPGGPHEILKDGVFGALVPVADVEAMAHAIQQALDVPPDRERIAAAAGDHSIQKTARQYIELIEGLG
jgi:glycosyltransferase involved in cell wall biosynthesis